MTIKTTKELLGSLGESVAAQYLSQKRLKVVDQHFQTRWGEIDLVCQDRDTWVFVEVKTRTRATQPSALDALTPAKQKRLVHAALSYLKKHGVKNQNVRFDVVTIEADRVEWIPDAFQPVQHFTY
jgi:putative endonuclease